MNKTLLISGAGVNQLAVIRKARELGFRTVVIDGNPNAPGLPLADYGICGDIRHADVLTQHARERAVDGIFPGAELTVEAVAAANETLGLPGFPRQVARRVRNKFAMREALAAAGIANPAFAGVGTLAEADTAMEAIGFPAIVKPADANSSKGVQRIDGIDELATAFEVAKSQSATGAVLLEAYMDGIEYNVDGLMYKNSFRLGGITGKELSNLPYRYDRGIYMPPPLPSEDLDAIASFTESVMRALGMETGICHAEVMMTADGPRIVEVAGRPGGGRIPSDLIPLAYGMDFLADAIRIVLGDAPRETRRHERAAALYWIPAEPGIVEVVEGLADARQASGVVDAVIEVKPGDVVDHIIDCVTRDRIGYVLAEGDTVDQAIAAACAARDRITVRTSSTSVAT